MLLRRLPLALLLSAALLPACDSGEDDEGGETVDCETVTVPKFADMTAWTKCTNCHSSTLTGTARNAAPMGIDFDTFDAAKSYAAIAAEEVREGAMPLSGYPALSDAEKEQIYNWAGCGTPQ